MSWLELSVRVPAEMVEPVVEFIQKYGGQPAIVEEAGGFNPDEGEAQDPSRPATVRTYLPENRWTAARRARIEAGVRLLFPQGHWPHRTGRRCGSPTSSPFAWVSGS